MDTSHIQEFLVLEKRQSYTAAAQELFISQPTLSRHISFLETELGVQLINRTRHGISLTPSGKAAADTFDEIVRCYDRLVCRIEAIEQEKIPIQQ